MNPHSILAIALNPALDLTLSLEELSLGKVNLANTSSLHPAGKGLNVARVAKDLGCDVTISGFLGLDNYDSFEKACEDWSVTNEFMVIPGATRTNVKLSEAGHRVTDINSPGLAIGRTDWLDLKNKLASTSDTYVCSVLTGSLPPGLPTSAYFELIEILRPKSGAIFLDSSGAAFTKALPASPSLIKPNLAELEQWAQVKITSPQQLLALAESILKQGIEHVIISNGDHGCYWFNSSFALAASTPRVPLVSTVGAGDSLVAGLAYSFLRKMPPEQGLSLACAVAAHAVEQVGVGVQDSDRIRELEQEISVKPFASLETL